MPDGDEWESSTRSLVAVVPDYDPGTPVKKSLLRLGAYEASEENNILAALPGAWGRTAQSALEVSAGVQYPGWLEYTDGDRTIALAGSQRTAVGGDTLDIIQGNELRTIGGTKTENIGGKYRLNIGAGTLEVVNADPVYFIQFTEQKGTVAAGKNVWRKTEKGHVSADTYSFGDTENFFGGYKFDAMFGLTNNIFVGGKADLALAASFAATIGFGVEVGVGVKYSYVEGKDLRTASDHEIKARESITLRIKTDHEGVGMSWKKGLALFAGGAGLAIAGGLAAGTKDGEVDSQGISSSVAGHLGGAAAAYAVGLVVAVICVLKDKKAAAMAKTQLKLDTGSICMRVNDATPAAAMRSAVLLDDATVTIANSLQSGIELQNNGDLALQAQNDLYLQNLPDTAGAAFGANGQVRIYSNSAAFDGILSLGRGGVLKVN